MYSFTLSLTLALDRGEWSTPRLRKDQYHYWAPGPVWTGAVAPTEIRSSECAACTKSLCRLSYPGPRQTVLTHYQNKWLENLERIPKMLYQRMRNPKSSVSKIPESQISDPESAVTNVYHAEDGGYITQKYEWIASTYR
jgi:hypothetical protein